MNIKTLGAVVVGVTALFGCSSNAADDTVVEPSRDQRIDALASTVCDRYADRSAGCPGYGNGTDQKYATETDCENDFRSRASQAWPAEKCSDGRIDNARYQTCVDRAKNYACSTGGQNIVDAISAMKECSSDEVCVDAPN